jgi:hypothetical protein
MIRRKHIIKTLCQREQRYEQIPFSLKILYDVYTHYEDWLQRYFGILSYY